MLIKGHRRQVTRLDEAGRPTLEMKNGVSSTEFVEKFISTVFNLTRQKQSEALESSR